MSLKDEKTMDKSKRESLRIELDLKYHIKKQDRRSLEKRKKMVDFDPAVLAVLKEARDNIGLKEDQVEMKCYNQGGPSAMNLLPKYVPVVNFVNTMDKHWTKFAAYHEMAHVKDYYDRRKTVEAMHLKFEENKKIRQRCKDLGFKIGVGGFAVGAMFMVGIDSINSKTTLQHCVKSGLLVANTAGIMISGMIAYKHYNGYSSLIKSSEKKNHGERKKYMKDCEHRANCMAMDALIKQDDLFTVHAAMCEFYAYQSVGISMGNCHPRPKEEYEHLVAHLKTHNLYFRSNATIDSGKMLLTLSKDNTIIHISDIRISTIKKQD